MADTPTKIETARQLAGGRLERARLFLSEVRNELKRVTWPSQKEVYATTVVVILTSVFFGLYLFILDYGINSLVQAIFRSFGAKLPPSPPRTGTSCTPTRGSRRKWPSRCSSACRRTGSRARSARFSSRPRTSSRCAAG